MGASRLAELNVVVLVLASGRGERFIASGGTTHKLDTLIRVDRQQITVLQATLNKALATGLRCHVERKNHAGMGDSIAAAVAANINADAWLILPADMPFVPAEVIRAVASGLEVADICVPMYGGQRGHPVGFSKRCRDDLLSLSGDTGARALFAKYRTQEVNVNLTPNAQGCLVDIDTVDDLRRAQTNLLI